MKLGWVAILLVLGVMLVNAQDRAVTIYLSGDSTCAIKVPERRPETGWGEVLQKYFDLAKAVVDNRAQNGRSTRTFIEQGHWQRITDALKKGDWVFVQFGHNDSAKDRPDRYTPPDDYRKNLIRFIDEVRAKKAEIVLLMPVVRRRFDKEGKFVDVHGEYPEIVRALAKEKKTALIDMHRRSQKILEDLGLEPSKKLFLRLKPGEHSNYPNGVDDNTHFNAYGADVIARAAVEGIYEAKIGLKKYLNKK